MNVKPVFCAFDRVEPKGQIEALEVARPPAGFRLAHPFEQFALCRRHYPAGGAAGSFMTAKVTSAFVSPPTVTKMEYLPKRGKTKSCSLTT